MAYQVYSKDRVIPGTNGEMNEDDLCKIMIRLEENNNLNYAGTVPSSERVINTLVMIKEGTKEELIERNRMLYEARGWEQYI
ncbi:hypothetical protein [uncultured Brachyspira sp.]|uniref:hypothetical protein n=1 Tax=uncultured Brachyspira sp. TaxID=221953 RepID=UPI00263612DF|nr:hypothetical protein [uncultured Brachyspira sp.]